jgi:hypothetical protein
MVDREMDSESGQFDEKNEEPCSNRVIRSGRIFRDFENQQA